VRQRYLIIITGGEDEKEKRFLKRLEIDEKTGEMKKDYIRIALRNIRRRKLRTVLTLVGILIGSMAVVSLFSVGDGVKKSITKEFEEMGMDKIMILPGGGNILSSMMSSASLSDADLNEVKKVEGVKIAGKMTTDFGKISFGDETVTKYVTGIPTDESKAVGSEGGAAAASADELAAELSNPNSSVASLTLKNQFRWYQGNLPDADKQSNYTMLFQPALPFVLDNGDKILFRPAIPVQRRLFWDSAPQF